MTQWSWQFRITGNGDTAWHTSVRPYDKAEDAAAGIAHCQAVLAMNGVILEARLVPHNKRPGAADFGVRSEPHVDGDEAAEKLINAIGFAGPKS